MTPSIYYGAVLIHEGGYKLVCADGFDRTGAHLVCKEVGFSYSINLCCSAFGPQKYELGVTVGQCRGDEESVRDCELETTNPTCPSGNYAAVVCAAYPSPFNRKYRFCVSKFLQQLKPLASQLRLLSSAPPICLCS